ncbi:CP2BA protein, partial [Polypterus senegalus]
MGHIVHLIKDLIPYLLEKIQHEIDTVIGRERYPAYEDRKKMHYTEAVIHEVQRFIDLVPVNLMHATTKDTIFRGYTIPSGTAVIPLLHSCLFDNKHWQTPYSFNPNHFLDENGCFRMNPAFLPFSADQIWETYNMSNVMVLQWSAWLLQSSNSLALNGVPSTAWRIFAL